MQESSCLVEAHCVKEARANGDGFEEGFADSGLAVRFIIVLPAPDTLVVTPAPNEQEARENPSRAVSAEL